MKPYLSVVIPAYNEKENFLNGALAKVNKYLSQQTYLWEVLIVDDGSTDGSAVLIDKFCKTHAGFRFIKNRHMGKAATVATGISVALGEFILFTDFDQATPLNEWLKLKAYLENGYNLVIGSREISGSKREKEPFYRHLMGRGFNWGVKLIVVRGISDTQCGFKAFEANAAKKIFSKLQVYKPKSISRPFVGAFDVEVLFIAKKLGYKIIEVPIHWYHVKTERINPLKDSIHMAWDVIMIRVYDLLGRYK